MKTLFISMVLNCLSLFSGAFAQTVSADAMVGTWTVQDGTAKIKIEQINGKYVGKIVWMNPATDKNGQPILDKKNKDAKLQSRPIMGLPMLQDFVYAGDGVWNSGTIYDPDGGDIYSCKITLVNSETLNVRGYVGISLFGRTETWKRSKDVAMK